MKISEPIAIERNGHRTAIKWHRGRRRAGDPVFTGRRILEGLALGASVEVDLVVHGGEGFAVLHDFTLDRETTGSGPVRTASPKTLRMLQLRNEAGEALPDPVMLLEDLCAMLVATPPHPTALLQLDVKEEASALTPGVVETFARAVGPVRDAMIASAGDAGAVRLLSAAVPGLRAGYDPCGGPLLAALRASGDYEAFVKGTIDAAPDATMIYLHFELVLAADRAGFDVVGAFQGHGKPVDAWTIRTVDDGTAPIVERLLALGVDQITTDDAEGFFDRFG